MYFYTGTLHIHYNILFSERVKHDKKFIFPLIISEIESFVKTVFKKCFYKFSFFVESLKFVTDLNLNILMKPHLGILGSTYVKKMSHKEFEDQIRFPRIIKRILFLVL